MSTSIQQPKKSVLSRTTSEKSLGSRNSLREQVRSLTMNVVSEKTAGDDASDFLAALSIKPSVKLPPVSNPSSLLRSRKFESEGALDLSANRKSFHAQVSQSSVTKEDTPFTQIVGKTFEVKTSEASPMRSAAKAGIRLPRTQSLKQISGGQTKVAQTDLQQKRRWVPPTWTNGNREEFERNHERARRFVEDLRERHMRRRGRNDSDDESEEFQWDSDTDLHAEQEDDEGDHERAQSFISDVLKSQKVQEITQPHNPRAFKLSFLDNFVQLEGKSNAEATGYALVSNKASVKKVSTHEAVGMLWNLYNYLKSQSASPLSRETTARVVGAIESCDCNEDDRLASIRKAIAQLPQSAYLELKALSTHLARLINILGVELLPGITFVFAPVFFKVGHSRVSYYDAPTVVDKLVDEIKRERIMSVAAVEIEPLPNTVSQDTFDSLGASIDKKDLQERNMELRKLNTDILDQSLCSSIANSALFSVDTDQEMLHALHEQAEYHNMVDFMSTMLLGETVMSSPAMLLYYLVTHCETLFSFNTFNINPRIRTLQNGKQ